MKNVSFLPKYRDKTTKQYLQNISSATYFRHCYAVDLEVICFKGSHFVKGMQKQLLKEISPEKECRERPLFDVKTVASKSRNCSQATRLILIFLPLRHESKYG